MTLKSNPFTSSNCHQHFFQTMSIKLIACSSEFCSAHGNNIICFKVFSMGRKEKQNVSKPIHNIGVGRSGIGEQTRKLSKWLLETLTKFRYTNPKPYCFADWYVFLSDMNDASGTLICSLNSNSLYLKYSVFGSEASWQLCCNHICKAEIIQLLRCLIPTSNLLLLQV